MFGTKAGVRQEAAGGADAACGVPVRSSRWTWGSLLVRTCLLGVYCLPGCTADVTGIHDDDWGAVVLLIAGACLLVFVLRYLSPRDGEADGSSYDCDFWGGGDGDDGGDGGD